MQPRAIRPTSDPVITAGLPHTIGYLVSTRVAFFLFSRNEILFMRAFENFEIEKLEID